MDEALSLLPGSKMPIRKASEEATGMTHQGTDPSMLIATTTPFDDSEARPRSRAFFLLLGRLVVMRQRVCEEQS